MLNKNGIEKGQKIKKKANIFTPFSIDEQNLKCYTFSVKVCEVQVSTPLHFSLLTFH